MIAKSTGYARGNRRAAGTKLADHLKYLQYRTMAQQETRADRAIFDGERDQVARREAIDDIMSHTSTSVNYHKIVLSPSKEEPVTDWKAWTRNIMRDLEDYKGQALHWYAVKHQNTDDPHVHVIIAGSGEDWRTGRPRAVKLYTGERAPGGRDDFAFLRERGREHSGYEMEQRNQELAWQIADEMDQVDREDHSIRSSTERTQTTAQRDQSRSSRGIDR